jgi:mono/diheme cytochrome c family protein
MRRAVQKVIRWNVRRAHARGKEGRVILKTRRLVLTGLGLIVAGIGLAGPARLNAQDKPAQPHYSTTVQLSERERRGEGFFLQRCSLCHLPRKLKFGSPPVIGPSLAGLFNDATPEQMKVLRGFILKGGPNMPGFQYGLEPREIDDLIAYLKTL